MERRKRRLDRSDDGLDVHNAAAMMAEVRRLQGVIGDLERDRDKWKRGFDGWMERAKKAEGRLAALAKAQAEARTEVGRVVKAMGIALACFAEEVADHLDDASSTSVVLRDLRHNLGAFLGTLRETQEDTYAEVAAAIKPALESLERTRRSLD